MKTAGKYDTVRIHYTCKTDDGKKFSTREHGGPIKLTIGKGKLLKPLEEAIPGMRINEKKIVKIRHEKAYGDWKKEWVKTFDKSVFPEEIELAEGLELYFGTDNGKEVRVKILEVKDKVVIIDENHFLAGKDLEFELELIEIL